LKKSQSLILSIVAGVLLIAAWPVSPFTFLIFFAWIPILFIAEQEEKTVRFFWFSYLVLLIWNCGTTWWIWNATGPGAIAAVIGNSFFMIVPIWGFYSFKKKVWQ
jgi:apolipoprotein N-acyltransferase